MLVNKAVQFAVLAAAVLLDSRADAATTSSVKFCGRRLSEIMSRVCQTYNGPAPVWEVPTVVEQPGTVGRSRRGVGGIADECCLIGCTVEQLSAYCAISASSVSPLEDMAHITTDLSAEQGALNSKDAIPATAAAPPAVGSTGHAAGQSGARQRGRGYGRGRRGRRCWCRRKRRSGRRRSSLMGNMGLVKSAEHRAAPIVGTVSPLFTSWGRTVNTNTFANRNNNYVHVVYT